MSVGNLVTSETTKLFTSQSTWILTLVTVLGTWPLAWTNASSGAAIPADDPRLFSALPTPLEYQGFEMTGFGYVLIVALAALWAGSEYGSGNQIRTTLLAAPTRLKVFVVKASILALLVGVVGFLTMIGTIMITHLAGATGIDPWTLNPTIWLNVAGVTAAWILMALIAFAVGVLSRSAVLPLILITPLVIGLGDFLAGIWDGAKYLPTAAGAAMYSDPALGNQLDPATGALVLSVWAAILLAAAAIVFVRRDL